jgi:hypothetical protein
MASKYYQGFFRCRNPQKYKGDPTQIVYRSSYELNFMMRLDRSEDVKAWSSESVIVPYTSPIDGRFHRYFVDMWVEKKNGEKYLIEIKPHAQTVKPVKGNKKEKTFLNEVKTWAVNEKKWESAKRFCDKRGWHFVILTEKELGLW